MLTNEKGIYRIDLEALIKGLGPHLYSNPKAVIRELIQNANDSCTVRATQEMYQPEIFKDERKLVVEDNGAGMARDEVVGSVRPIFALHW